MSNSMKGMIAGFVATLVLSGLLLLKSTMDLVPELNIIRLLTNLGSISAPETQRLIGALLVNGLLHAAIQL